jgi:hypothetical protein
MVGALLVPATLAAAEDGRAAVVPSCNGIIYDANNANIVLYPDDATFNADGFAVVDARGTNVDWIVMENPAYNWPTFDKGLMFLGGAGDELVCGAQDRNDFIKAGAGDDTVFGNDGYQWQNPYTPANIRVKRTAFGNPDPWVGDIINGQMGDDYLDANNSPLDTTAVGANRDVLISGGAGDDTIDGAGGFLGQGLVGWDFLRGRSGNDTIYGMHGADQVYGDLGDDILYGGTAFDEVKGGLGDDQTWGGDGNMLDVFVDVADYLVGGPGNDIQVGEEGNDEIVGASGNDMQYGSSGDDWICGGTDADDIYGETGNDNMFANGCPRQADGLTIGTPGANAQQFYTLNVNNTYGQNVGVGTDYVPQSADWIEYEFLPAAAIPMIRTLTFTAGTAANEGFEVCGQNFRYVSGAPATPNEIDDTGSNSTSAIRTRDAINNPANGLAGCVTATRSGGTVTITAAVPGTPGAFTLTDGPGSTNPIVGAVYALTQVPLNGVDNCAAAGYDACVLIGGNEDVTHANLVAAVNGGAGLGTAYAYGTGFGPHTTVSVVAADLLTNVSTWQVDAPGAAGNVFEAEEASNGDFVGAANPSTFSGGVDPTGFSNRFDYFRGHDGAIDELFGGEGNNNYFSCDPTGLRDPATNALLGYVNQDQAYFDTIPPTGGADSTWGISVYVAGVTPDNHFPNAGAFAATFPTLFPCMDLYGLP